VVILECRDIAWTVLLRRPNNCKLPPLPPKKGNQPLQLRNCTTQLNFPSCSSFTQHNSFLTCAKDRFQDTEKASLFSEALWSSSSSVNIFKKLGGNLESQVLSKPAQSCTNTARWHRMY
jgi:hypothetical protein